MNMPQVESKSNFSIEIAFFMPKQFLQGEGLFLLVCHRQYATDDDKKDQNPGKNEMRIRQEIFVWTKDFALATAITYAKHGNRLF